MIIRYQKQQGMILVVSLLILIALTLLGLTSMQATRTEISMAGNLSESGLTFNAAEVGLNSGETFTDDSISKTVFSDPDQGLYDETDDDPDYYEEAVWEDSQTASITLPHVEEQPRFIVRFLGDRAQNEAALVNIGGYGSVNPGMIVSNFRITSRGTGQTGNSHRLIQSYFGKEY
ncbi:MAG: pilus assembly protein [Gammaproteobacteria bacterium]|nr:pilus assembly protein [Gammaproteobacteria bacterium]